MDAPARHFRADGARADRLPRADHRRRQWRGLWWRLRDRGRLRFSLRGGHRPLRTDRSDARHHAGRRRHANPAARRRRAPGQGIDPDRQALHREPGSRLGSRERSISPARFVTGSAGDRIAHRPQCADLGPPGQALDPSRPAILAARRARARDRGLQPDGARPRTAAKACWPSTRSGRPTSGDGEPVQSNRLGVWFTTAPSIASIFSFVTTPPLAEKPPGLPPAASTRWQGTTIGHGLRPSA